MQLLRDENQRVLEAQGFGIAELTGFEDHSIPLYAHHSTGDKAPGDVVLRARVSNPDALDDGEASYLARKAFHGMFPWQPGAECMRREFVDVQISRKDSSVTESPRVAGCRWCRKGEVGSPKSDSKGKLRKPRRSRASAKA